MNNEASTPAFDSLVFAKVLEQHLLRPGYEREVDPLKDLAYEDELSLKTACIEEFWKLNGLPGRPEPVIASPMPRRYRTTTKRRVVMAGSSVSLVFDPGRPSRGPVSESVLEPEAHAAIYRHMHAELSVPRMRQLARSMNFVIIRGGYESFCLICNVRGLDRAAVAAFRAMAGRIEQGPLHVRSCYLYVDPTGSDYYLDTGDNDSPVECKRLFGPRILRVTVDGVKLTYPPTVFSQINESMLPVLVRTARELLAPSTADRFLDLYCGYGLFACSFAARAGQTVGVEMDGPAVAAAIGNAGHTAAGRQVRFVAGRISAGLIGARLPQPDHTREIVLLDPPRGGTEQGVVEAVAERHPARVVHVFCGTDRIPPEIARWQNMGYRMERIVPLDMFPGTSGLETLVLLTPKANPGLLQW